jgi:hypothetical protein
VGYASTETPGVDMPYLRLRGRWMQDTDFDRTTREDRDRQREEDYRAGGLKRMLTGAGCPSSGAEAFHEEKRQIGKIYRTFMYLDAPSMAR